MISHGFLQGFVGILLEIAKLLRKDLPITEHMLRFVPSCSFYCWFYLLYRECETKSSEVRTFAHVRWCQAVKFPDEALPVACFVNMQETQMTPRLRLIQTVLSILDSRSFQNQFSILVNNLSMFVYFPFCFVHIMVIHVPTPRDRSKTGCQWRFPSWSCKWEGMNTGYGLNGCLCT